MNLATDLRRRTEETQRKTAEQTSRLAQATNKRESAEAEIIIMDLPLKLKKAASESAQPEMVVMKIRREQIANGKEDGLILAAEVDSSAVRSRLQGAPAIVADWLVSEGLGFTVCSKPMNDAGQGRAWNEILLVATW